jgi:hypothetical protein
MAPSGIPAVFYLSSAGEQALGMWIRKRSSFPALMKSYDTVGAWIQPPWDSGERQDSTEPVMLLKWEYVATVTFEMAPEQHPVRTRIGF